MNVSNLSDGKSPLSNYVALLIAVSENLERLLNRDAEAVRILTADPALPEAERRAQRWLSDRHREKWTGKRICTPRDWTRRDELEINLLRRLRSGLHPARRTRRYASSIGVWSRESEHDRWFRLAVNESRRDGTAAVLWPKLDQAKVIYDRMVSAALSCAQSDAVSAARSTAVMSKSRDAFDQAARDRATFQQAKTDLGSLACELAHWSKRAGAQDVDLEFRSNGDRSVEGIPATKDIGMEKDSPLQRIDKSFLDLGTALGCLSDMLMRLQRINRDYELEFFGRHGEIISIKKRRGEPYDPADFGESDEERDLPAEVDEAHAHELREIGQFVPEFVASMLQAQRDAIAAVDSLPREILEELSALKDKPWAALVRRTCLNHVAAWPDEQLETFGGPKILDHVGYLLNEAERFDPHGKWAEYRQLLAEYRADALAVRMNCEVRSIRTMDEGGIAGDEKQSIRQAPEQNPLKSGSAQIQYPSPAAMKRAFNWIVDLRDALQVYSTVSGERTHLWRAAYSGYLWLVGFHNRHNLVHFGEIIPGEDEGFYGWHWKVGHAITILYDVLGDLEKMNWHLPIEGEENLRKWPKKDFKLPDGIIDRLNEVLEWLKPFVESIEFNIGQEVIENYKEAHGGSLPPPIKISDAQRQKLEALADHAMLAQPTFDLPILVELTDDEALAGAEDVENRSSVGDSGGMVEESVDAAVEKHADGEGKPTFDKKTYSEPENYGRDKWIYEQRVAERTWPDIQAELNGPENGWAPLYSENGMRNALKNYCTFHKLDIPKGRSGRPKRQ